MGWFPHSVRPKYLISWYLQLPFLTFSVKGDSVEKPANSLVVSLDKAINEMPQAWVVRQVVREGSLTRRQGHFAVLPPGQDTLINKWASTYYYSILQGVAYVWMSKNGMGYSIP